MTHTGWYELKAELLAVPLTCFSHPRIPRLICDGVSRSHIPSVEHRHDCSQIHQGRAGENLEQIEKLFQHCLPSILAGGHREDASCQHSQRRLPSHSAAPFPAHFSATLRSATEYKVIFSP